MLNSMKRNCLSLLVSFLTLTILLPPHVVLHAEDVQTETENPTVEVIEETTEPEIPVNPGETEEPETPITVTLTYNANGGTFKSTNSTTLAVEYEQGSTVDALTTAAPVRTSYRFAGWTLNNQPVSAGFVIDDNLELKASWKVLSGVWKQDRYGWWYRYSDGSYPKNAWAQINGKWYHFNSSGYMQTGWLNLSGTWYYLNADGSRKTGWLSSGGYWYYLNSEGKMLTGLQSISGKKYYFDGSGHMKTGWISTGGSWYYFKPYDGYAVTGWQSLGGYWYYLNSEGKMLTGLQTISGKKYYFDGSGHMKTGWVSLSGNWYYFLSGGSAAVTWTKIGSNYYNFTSEGVMNTSKDGFNPNAKYTLNSSGYFSYAMPVNEKYFKQTDPRWSDLRYGGKSIYFTGCGICTIAMCLTQVLQTPIYPNEVAEYLHSVNQFNTSAFDGTSGTARLKAAEHWDVSCSKITGRDQFAGALISGKMISMMTASGFSTGSHGVVAMGYNNGKTWVYDPFNSGNNGWYTIDWLWNCHSTKKDDMDAGATVFAYAPR